MAKYSLVMTPTLCRVAGCIIHVEYGGSGICPYHQKKEKLGKYFSGKYHIKIGHCVNFYKLTHVFGQNVLSPNLTELHRKIHKIQECCNHVVITAI